MTVLSGAYIAMDLRIPTFGRAKADVLECLNCLIVKDVPLWRVFDLPALRDCGTTLVPSAERLLVE